MRFVDVIFAKPSGRYYVVLHQGQFWQLPRLSLTKSAWSLKTPYKGELGKIFVVKSQAVPIELQAVLQPIDLPAQLGGVNASQFLAWWQTHSYAYSQNSQNNTNNQSTLHQTTPPKDQPVPTPTNTQDHINNQTSKATQNQTANTQKTTATNTVNTAPNADNNNKNSNKNNSNDDLAVFDDLLEQLNSELR